MADPYCDHLASPNPFAFALSLFLVVGILVSYLPQHYKIISNGTSAGLSPWWVLLGTLSSVAGITNIIVLPTSQHDMTCCKEINAVACGSALLGIVQVGVQWVCFMAIMILFLTFFPRRTDTEQSRSLPEEAEDELPSYKSAVIVMVSCLVAILVAGLGSMFFLVSSPQYLLGWANFLGIVASILASIQYIPQIWTTYRLGQVLSLSIVTMLIQVPGAFVFAFSLWLRVGWQGWSTWLVYCVTGILQSLLLFLAIRFWMRDRKLEQEAQAGQDGGVSGRAATERDPLLAGRSDEGGRPQNSSTLRTIKKGGKQGQQNGKRSPLDALYQASSESDNSLFPGSASQRT